MDYRLSAVLPLIGCLGFNVKTLDADKKGVSPYDIDERIKTEVIQIICNLKKAVE